jgi:hypothetical protein
VFEHNADDVTRQRATCVTKSTVARFLLYNTNAAHYNTLRKY